MGPKNSFRLPGIPKSIGGGYFVVMADFLRLDDDLEGMCVELGPSSSTRISLF